MKQLIKDIFGITIMIMFLPFILVAMAVAWLIDEE
jgi:hypothetical protein